MKYQQVATSKHQALIIYLLDVSASMKSQLAGRPRIDHLNEALEGVLQKMVARANKAMMIAPRYRMSIIAYSNEAVDILDGVKTITEVASMGAPTFSVVELTNSHAAFVKARSILEQELPKMNACPAPLVCHVTDGQYTGADPEPVVREIMEMGNDDGNVLVENIYVGNDLTSTPIDNPATWPGIQSEAELNSNYLRKLYRMSSPMPLSFSTVLEEYGFSFRAGTPMLFPASTPDIIQLAFVVSGSTGAEDPRRPVR